MVIPFGFQNGGMLDGFHGLSARWEVLVETPAVDRGRSRYSEAPALGLRNPRDITHRYRERFRVLNIHPGSQKAPIVARCTADSAAFERSGWLRIYAFRSSGRMRSMTCNGQGSTPTHRMLNTIISLFHAGVKYLSFGRGFCGGEKLSPPLPAALAKQRHAAIRAFPGWVVWRDETAAQHDPAGRYVLLQLLGMLG